MAKRVRRTVRRTAARPGTRPPSTARPPLTSPIEELEPTSMRIRSGGLTADEMARAAELEAEIVAREHAQEQAAATEARRAKARTAREAVAYDPNVPLRIRAAHEYAYVARDVKRIGLTAGLMVAILVGLHFVINVAGIIKL
jgi:hypothetical protein